MSSRLQLDMRNLSLGRRHLVNAYEVEAGIGLIAGNTVWSMPERLECEVLQKARYINTLTFTFTVYIDMLHCNMNLCQGAYTGNTMWTLECAIGLLVGGALHVTIVTVTVEMPYLHVFFCILSCFVCCFYFEFVCLFCVSHLVTTNVVSIVTIGYQLDEH